MLGLWVFSLLSVVHFDSVLSQYPRDVVATLAVTNGEHWGNWQGAQFCPLGTYAHNFQLQVEWSCNCDDTALNGIELQCFREGGTGPESSITSGRGALGEKTTLQECIMVGEHSFFLTNFALRVEPDRGNIIDDTAANNLRMECRERVGTETFYLEGEATTWGSWGTWSGECPQGSAICGIQTRVEVFAVVDNTALNDVRFYCCDD